MPKQFWCIPCRAWHEGRVCGCGVPSGAGANAYLYTAKLNANLYAQAEKANAEKKLMQAMRSGREPDPPKWARQRAKEIVAGL